MVRGFDKNPLEGGFVVIDFSDCTDTRLCAAAVDGQVVDCPNHRITGFTDENGKFEFIALGGGLNSGSTTAPPAHHPPGATEPCARIYTDGVLLCVAKVNAIDQNGAMAFGNGLTGVDGSLVLGSVLAVAAGAPYKPLFDLNRDGAVTGVDGSAALGGILGGAGGCSSAYCP